MQATAGAARIEDHGLIGDLQTAALVDINGSIDWLCLPRFDSGAAFTALLGEEEHGHWTIQPAVEPPPTRVPEHHSGRLLLQVEEVESFRNLPVIVVVEHGRLLAVKAGRTEANG